MFHNFRVEIFDLGGGGGINNVPKPSSPQSGVVVGASNGIQPQGTTRRPPVATQTPRPLPSLAEVTTQSPNPQSPFIQDNPQNVPGTSIGELNLRSHLSNVSILQILSFLLPQLCFQVAERPRFPWVVSWVAERLLRASHPGWLPSTCWAMENESSGAGVP